jgi:hypothetical protein
MTCAEFRDALPDLVEDTLDKGRRASLEAHAESCPECRAIADDLREIRKVARTLERHAPPRAGWTRLSERLEANPDLLSGQATPVESGRRGGTGRWVWLALAASLVLGIGTAAMFVVRGFGRTPATTAVADPRPTEPSSAQPGSTQPGNAPTSTLVESVESEVQLAAEHLEKAAAGMEQIVRQGDSTVDPEVMANLKQSLAVIDQAIGDSRSALRAQPENRVAQESLFDAFRRKVSLLQDTIALMNEMRKGNQAGAAKIAESEKS